MRTSHEAPVRAAFLCTILGLVAIGLQGCNDAAASQTDPAAANAFVKMVCTHVANRTAEYWRRDWISQLWDSCHTYVKHTPTKAIPHEKCLEVGIEGIADAGTNATMFMMEKCLQVAQDCGNEGSTCVADAYTNDNNFLGKNGHYPEEEQLVSDMFEQSLKHAKQEADALSKKLDGMSKDELANCTGNQEAKDKVIFEWCMENAQGGLHHQMRVDVIKPLFHQCRRFGAIAVASEAQGGPPRKSVITKCLEVGAMDIQKLAEEFVNDRLDSCTKLVRNSTGDSLLELQHSVITLRRQFGVHYDVLFEKFRHILADAKSEATALLGDVKATPANTEGEQKFTQFGGRLDLEADTIPLANLFPVLFVIMTVLTALTTGGTAVLSAWQRAHALRIATDNNEEMDEPLGRGFSISI